ncbi:hypothetical protein Tco_0613351 [Tanacetum coccineum]
MREYQKNANPLALVVAAQQYPDPYYQAPKSHESYAPPSKQSSSTRSNASTKYKGKEIANQSHLPTESSSRSTVITNKLKRIRLGRKTWAHIAKNTQKDLPNLHNNLKTSSNSRNKNVDTSPRYKNDNQTGQFGNQRTVTVAGAKETVGSKVVQQTGIQCFNCNDLTGQNAEECDDERATLANLIANLTLDTEENKKILKQLKKVNASLTQELKECKSNLEESNTTRDSCLVALQNYSAFAGSFAGCLQVNIDTDATHNVMIQSGLVIEIIVHTNDKVVHLFQGMLLECQGCMNEQEGRLLMIEYMDLVRQNIQVSGDIDPSSGAGEAKAAEKWCLM